MAVINGSLKQTAPYGPSTQQTAFDAQRQALYAAYQNVLSQMDAGNEGDADRVLAAAESLRDKSQAYAQSTESARQQWFERESEVQRVMDRVTEMKDNGHEKADQIREVIEKIQAKVNEGCFGESTQAADQLLPKFDPIYEEYLYQSGQQGNTTPPLGEYGGEDRPGPDSVVPLGEYGGDIPPQELEKYGELPLGYSRFQRHTTKSPFGQYQEQPTMPLGEYTGEQPFGQREPNISVGGGGSGADVPLGEYGGDPSLAGYNSKSPFGQYQDQPTVPLGEYQGDEGRPNIPSTGGGSGGGYGTETPAPYTRSTGCGMPLGEYGGEEITGDYGSDVIDNIPLDPGMYGTGAPWKHEDVEQLGKQVWEEVQKAQEVARERAGEAWDEATSTASTAADCVRKPASNVADSVNNTASEVAGAVSETASQAYDTGSDAASEALGGAKDAWDSAFG